MPLHFSQKDRVVTLVSALNANRPSLPPGDQTFALQLVNKYATFGNLSEKQLFWVSKLLVKAIGVPDFTGGANVELAEGAAPAQPSKFEKLFAMFAAAKATGMKNVAFQVMVSNETFRLRLSGKGNVFVIAGGAADFLGTIMQGGVFKKGVHAAGHWDDALAKLLILLELDPVGLVKDYGKLTSKCSFCNLELTDPTSVHHGYGKVCASKWGLPWNKLECLPA